MSLSQEEVKKIAKLCRIELSEDEVEKYQKELSQVLGYVEELNQVNTEGIEPISQVTGLQNVLREDRAEQSDLREKIIANFPDSKDGYLKIKNIL
jgi:aspartyl-tRNA(Asn)/glutamyl-tRNA(Gln) amidotransferase subunit C